MLKKSTGIDSAERILTHFGKLMRRNVNITGEKNLLEARLDEIASFLPPP